MADQTDSSPQKPGTVQFKEDAVEKPYPMKHVPTQRYDRKEIQKRLDLENWMDDHLRELYDGDEGYPELDLDDIMVIDESERESKLKEYLKDAKRPCETFIKELLEKAAKIKPGIAS